MVMATEPTAKLTFGDLLLEAALELGTAYYGASGDEAAQVPTDAHDLAEAKRHVNNAVRMFFADTPTGGWRWQRPVASVVLWPSLTADATRTVSGGAFSGGVTTLTANTSVFHESMEEKSIVITGVGTFTMTTYVSGTQMIVTGDASTASSAEYTITSDGNYTLPVGFSGSHSGHPTYAAETGQGIELNWADEATIRDLREDTLDTNFPRLLAVRVRSGGRRWELMAYPAASSVVTVEFPYHVYFTLLDATTDLVPIPFMFDDAMRAAVLHVVERDAQKVAGHHTQYYRSIALPNAWAVDGRSAPRRLGMFGNPDVPTVTPQNFRDFRSRPVIDTTNI